MSGKLIGPMLKNPFSSRNTRPGALPFRYTVADRVTESSARERTVTRILRRLNRHRCGAIVGPHGSGKTTLLHDLAPDLSAAMPDGQWVLLTRDPNVGLTQKWRTKNENWDTVRKAQSAVAKESVLVIDGAEQLSTFQRLRIRWTAWRRNHHVLITCHRPLKGFVVLHETKVTAALVRVLVDELLSAARVGPDTLGQHQNHVDRKRVTEDQPWDDTFALDALRFDEKLPDQNVRRLWSKLYDEIGGQSERGSSVSAAEWAKSLHDTPFPRAEVEPWRSV